MGRPLLVLFFSLSLLFAKAQLYSHLGSFHNQLFFGGGYTFSFSNVSYGWQHTKYFKRLKKHISGILDVETPVDKISYTRFVIRKGFQLDLYKKGDFKVPLAVISSSARKHYQIFNFHDLVTDFYLLPGLYTEKYTIAADLCLNVIWFRKTHFDEHTFTEITPPGHQGWSTRLRLNPSVGIALGYNLHRFNFLLRGGIQRPAEWEVYKFPFYAALAAGMKFNFKKHPAPEVQEESKSK